VASKSLEEWLKILWENEFEYVVSLCVCVPVPCGWGFASPFIDQGGGECRCFRPANLPRGYPR
jgi:hypothetical protein